MLRDRQSQLVGPQLSAPTLEDVLLSSLPLTSAYQRSYMHRDVISHIIVSSKLDFIVTASQDGHLKFWKKVYFLIEFVKHFKSHSSHITSLSLNQSHTLMASSSLDKTVKLYDTQNYDLSKIVKLQFSVGGCQFIASSTSYQPLLALIQQGSTSIHIVNPYAQEGSYIRKTLQLHIEKIVSIKSNHKYDFCVTADEGGIIQFWNHQTGDFPKESLRGQMRIKTDLIKIQGQTISSLTLSPRGNLLGIFSKPFRYNVYQFSKGKLIFELDEGLESQLKADYGTVVCQFDQNQKFIFAPSLSGIKVFQIATRNLIYVIGKQERTERFVKVFLYQGKVMKNPAGSSTITSCKKQADPTLYCVSARKNRFYIFSKRQPQLSEGIMIRDILNERPNKEQVDQLLPLFRKEEQSKVQVQTTLGDFTIHLYTMECPKTCQNFIKLVKKGYYEGHIFHRIIRGFINQTGCPNGNGSGGQSFWGGYFEDQFHPRLRHDRGFTVSMANHGPNTNGSQFFITVRPAEWLDNRHSLFGRIFSGMQVVQTINKVKVDKNEMPFVPPKIIKMIAI